ncbi:MAG: PD40 domain-containing protein [Anaerolineales bacterium]|nr:PD40 domain-containing protein [Anaerolineales bacterium]
MERKMDYRKLIIVPVLALFLTACTLEIAQMSATEAVPFAGSQASTPTEPTLTATFDPTTATPAATITQTSLPSAEGGWILVHTGQGLWTARPDGSEGTLRITGPLIIPGPLTGAISSADGNFAYLTTSDFNRPYGNYPDLKLNIISLFGRGPAVSLPLTSPVTEPGGEFPSDIIRAMVEHKSFAWSPDGRSLAYIGAASGPSADVYEYLRESNTFMHLTDGPDQAYNPIWSPDGKWIVHAAAAGFGTGAGIAVTGFYAARADGSGTMTVYNPSEFSGGEEAIGWLNDHTLVARSWYMTCGPSDLRMVELNTPMMSFLLDGCLSAAAVGAGSVLFAQSPGTAAFDENPKPGLWIYISSDSGGTLTQLSPADIREIVWSEGSGTFLALASDNHLYEVLPTGQIRVLAENQTRIPMISPDGLFWAMADSEGVWAGKYGQPMSRIFSGQISPSQMLFVPPDDTLYFLDAAGSLYAAQESDWAPNLLATNLQPAGSDLALGYVLDY